MGRLLDIAKQARSKVADDYNVLPPAPVKTELAPLQEVLSYPAHVRPLSDFDDCDRAVYAIANGLPRPAGWWCLTGTQLMASLHPEQADHSSAPVQARKTIRSTTPPRLAPGTCPGCFQPITEAQLWEDGPVCSSCHSKATASPGGFAITLSRACRWNQTAEAMA